MSQSALGLRWVLPRAKYSAGPLSHDRMMRCIELYGRKVIPLVREMLA